MLSAILLICVLNTTDCVAVGSGPVSTEGQCRLIAMTLMPLARSMGWHEFPDVETQITTFCQETKEA
jgi:hypothetical protein